jgi:hypothetical protein
MPFGWRGFRLALAGAVLGAAPRLASACATCEAGDSTLTVAGTELPFAGRLRSALELRRRTDSIGRAGLDETRISELRADVSTAWVPFESLVLMARVPLIYRDVRDASLAHSETWGVGDIELRAKWFLFEDRAFAPRVLVAWGLGAKLPVAPSQRDARGERLPLEAQPGSGSLDLVTGPSLSIFSGPLSAYLGVQWSEPLLARAPLDPGRSVSGSFAAQYQLTPWAALRPALDALWSRPSRENGARDPNSGGQLLLAGADALFSAAEDSSVLIGFRLPALERLRGAHEQGAIVSLALLHDW